MVQMTKRMTKTAINESTKDRATRSFVAGVKFLKWAVLGVLLATVLSAFAIIVDGLSDDIQSSDVAVILGSKVELTGHPSARLAARLDRGVALYKAGVTKTLIVSGGTGTEGFNEAVVMRDYLSRMGVPSSEIVMDGMGYNTEETAKNCAAIMKSHGFKSVIIVTQYFHVSRTRMALKFHDIKDIRSAHAHYFELRDIYSTAREALALPVYWVRGLLLSTSLSSFTLATH